MKKIDKCPICNEQKLGFLYACKDYSTSGEIFNISICLSCDFIFTNPRPKDENLGKYYLSDNYISHTNKRESFFEKAYHLVRKISIKWKLRLVKKYAKRKSHLDIGCGTGEFLSVCKQSGFETIGVEPSEKARKQAVENYGLTVFESIEISNIAASSVETISMWHVLEHVPNLIDTIQNLNRILISDGTLLIAVPNPKSWDAKYYKAYWAAWDVPIHLWHFSKKNMIELFSEHGFILKKTKPMLFDSFYVALLSEEYKSGRKNWIKAIMVGLYSNLIGIFSNNGCSSTIYIFVKKKN